MTSESEKLAPCPFCHDPMVRVFGLIKHVEQGKCIIGAMAFDESFLAAWNRRSPEGYDVAPLEWERVNDYRHYAKCVIGYYDVRDSLVSPGQWFFELNDRSADPLLFPTLDEAKAAAEADYRQRILSALRPRHGTAPAVGGEPFEWRCPECGSAETAARVKAEGERDDARAALDADPGNPWRFWRDKATKVLADKAKAEARVRELEEALSGPAAWLERWATHVGSCRGGSVCTCGLTLARHEIAATLLADGQPKPR